MPFATILLILVLVAGFYMAWNIGANDVANAMGTSVGSHALTLKQAVLVAAVLEFTGALLFGSHVSDTVQSGIVNPSLFANDPQTLLFGMFAALISTGVWLQIASYFGWPVSTTHAIIGAIVGFGVVAGGWNAIYWQEISLIAMSWVISPLLGGAIAFILFRLLCRQILYKRNPLQASHNLIPLLLFAVLLTFSPILIYNLAREFSYTLPSKQVMVLSFLISALASALSYISIQNKKSSSLPKRSEQYPLVEKSFSHLQILTACFMAFAHGANDVANSIGPMSACIKILQTGKLSQDSTVPVWLLAIGGVGIVVGLATWGWRVIETIGKKLTELTPTRGFAAEFGAAFTILTASHFGLPISTTHTLVGAVIGVGLARGIRAINTSAVRDIFLSWVITLPVAAGICIFFFLLIQATLGRFVGY